MAEYSKKLHIRKAGVITDIKLYSTIGEVGSNYITLKDGSNVIYGKLGSTGDANVSNLRVRKSSTIYGVLKMASIPYTEISYTSVGTYTFTVPQGITRIRVAVIGGAGGGMTNYGDSYYVTSAGGASSVNGLISAGGGGGISCDGSEIFAGGGGGSPNGNGGNHKQSIGTANGAVGHALSFTNAVGTYGGSSSMVNSINGNYAYSGGGGGWNTAYFTVSSGATYTVVVGSKGADYVQNGSWGHVGTAGQAGAVLIAYGVGVEP